MKVIHEYAEDLRTRHALSLKLHLLTKLHTTTTTNYTNQTKYGVVLHIEMSFYNQMAVLFRQGQPLLKLFKIYNFIAPSQKA